MTFTATDLFCGDSRRRGWPPARDGRHHHQAEVVNFARAKKHLAVRKAYESLPEISELPMLVRRIESLLLLKSSPIAAAALRSVREALPAIWLGTSVSVEVQAVWCAPTR